MGVAGGTREGGGNFPASGDPHHDNNKWKGNYRISFRNRRRIRRLMRRKDLGEKGRESFFFSLFYLSIPFGV